MTLWAEQIFGRVQYHQWQGTSQTRGNGKSTIIDSLPRFLGSSVGKKEVGCNFHHRVGGSCIVVVASGVVVAVSSVDADPLDDRINFRTKRRERNHGCMCHARSAVETAVRS